jgi:hypothetical protein
MAKITSCVKCHVSDKYWTICQQTGKCASCYGYDETLDRIQRNEFYGCKCPYCGSHDYSEGTYYEQCHSCGHEQGY